MFMNRNCDNRIIESVRKRQPVDKGHFANLKIIAFSMLTVQLLKSTSGSAMAEGPRDALVSRNSATTKHPI